MQKERDKQREKQNEDKVPTTYEEYKSNGRTKEPPKAGEKFDRCIKPIHYGQATPTRSKHMESCPIEHNQILH
uniref:Uncharacterized protein n=1 Tax=Lotus japonicus TaxID=34305 RepID=I3SDM7_LOTJA|nr:unknown [Lotus japonicus]